MIFEQEDFKVFDEQTLDGRMQGIRAVIDPKFEQLAKVILPLLSEDGQAWYAHIAKHLRRTTNPPENTWVAFAPNKRGYKMMPHYEVGMWDDHVYIYLAVEENMKPASTQKIVAQMTKARELVAQLPATFTLSQDHMVNKTEPLTLTHYDLAVQKFAETKHSEVLIGLQIMKSDYETLSFEDTNHIMATFKALRATYEIIK